MISTGDSIDVEEYEIKQQTLLNKRRVISTFGFKSISVGGQEKTYGYALFQKA